MKKHTRNIWALLFSLIVCSCGGSGDDDGSDNGQETSGVSLSITTSIQTRAVMTNFSSGQKMAIFVKNVGNPTASDFCQSVTASYNGSTWAISPSVPFKQSDKAYVYAVYPYSENITNASAIPVGIEGQTDYLYSGDAVAVAYSSPQAVLTMKHAMAMMAFNIVSQDYTSEGKLTSIKLAGDGLALSGTMNVSTGKITSTSKGEYTISANKTISASGWTDELPQFFCIPFSSTGSNLTAVFNIDGKDHTVVLPKYEVAMGMKYVFRLVLTDNGLTILPAKTEAISLNKNDGVLVIDNYNTLRLTYTSQTVSIPEIKGSDVAGMVYWGDNTQEPYSYPLSHTYSSNGEHNIMIETWGGEKAQLSDLSSVDVIDLTNF